MSRASRKPSDVRVEVERLWAEGKTAREIAEAVGWRVKNPNAVINTYRRRGWHLPHRQDMTRVKASRSKRWPTKRRDLKVES